MGQTWVLGGAPNSDEQAQKILVLVNRRAWTSRPITGIQFDIARDYRKESGLDWRGLLRYHSAGELDDQTLGGRILHVEAVDLRDLLGKR
jgi:hypothetical protein